MKIIYIFIKRISKQYKYTRIPLPEFLREPLEKNKGKTVQLPLAFIDKFILQETTLVIRLSNKTWSQ